MPGFGYRNLRAAWTEDLQDGGAVRAVFRLLEEMGRCGLVEHTLSRETRDALRELQWQSSSLYAGCAEVFAPQALKLEEVARRMRSARRSDPYRGPDVALSAEIDPKKGFVIRWDPHQGEDVFIDHHVTHRDNPGLRELVKLQAFAKILPGVPSREPGTCDVTDDNAVRGHIAAAAVRLYRDTVEGLGICCTVFEAARMTVSLDEDTGEILAFGIERVEPEPDPELVEEGPVPGR
jgi:hypothetical protein